MAGKAQSIKLAKHVSIRRLPYLLSFNLFFSRSQVQMDNLKSNTRYFYQVGDPSAGFSDVFSFLSTPLPSDDIPQVVGMFGKPVHQRVFFCSDQRF
jgi:hypothetical protein